MATPKDLCALLGRPLPLLQAPMAGSSGVRLAVAVNEAGGLGSLPCALLSADGIRKAVADYRSRTVGPINLNFFAHEDPVADATREAAWIGRLKPYYEGFGVAPPEALGTGRGRFDDALCAVVEDVQPDVVSFHFGIPDEDLMNRVHAAGAKILSSATTVDEARYLEDHGCDAIIAQGVEAGGHRGMFLSEDIATQIGTMSLTPLVVDAVRVPVIAAGGIGDRRGIAAALALGASGVQIGTAYLRCPESDTTAAHRAGLAMRGPTALTNVFTGRPARSIVNRFVREQGPMSADVPAFPRAVGASAPLRAAAEARGETDFSPLWAGESFPLSREASAAEVTAELMGGFAG
ncbi:MAG TPA: nitronate monooxygenase [Hyphomonadaceae bacterium]|nr:nitronate monooxygenase [Hyphomonadaceae bacterium]